MTLTKRLRQFFYPASGETTAVEKPLILSSAPTPPTFTQQPATELLAPNSSPTYELEPLPNWLADEENLRDEGVFFGLSDAPPDGKLTQIQAFYARQAAPLEEAVKQYTSEIGELNRLIDQHETHVSALREQCSVLSGSQPGPTNGIRTVASLLLSVLMCIGNFYLIDETLRPVFPDRWIAVGIYLAGMFNLFGRTSFFYEEGTPLTGRRMVAEIGLPLATSVFVLTQALQTSSVGQAIALFAFVFSLFLLAGKLLLSQLNACQTTLTTIQKNRQLVADKVQNLPIREAEIVRIGHEIGAIRTQKRPLVAALTHTQIELTRLNTQRDWLVNLFVSEFELARSLRDRLPEQQKTDLLRSYKVV